MAATELKDYTAREDKQKEVEEDGDSFAIDDEPVMEANDHMPIPEDSPRHPFPRFDDTTDKSKTENTIPITNDTKSNDKPATKETTQTSSTTTPTIPAKDSTTPTPASSQPAKSNASTPSSSLPATPNGSPKPSSNPAKTLLRAQLASSGGISAPGTPENERMVLSYNERLKMYEDVLQSDILEIPLLRELAWQGIPEAKGLRSIYWKILLHYLPKDKALWAASLARDRKLYQDWVKELVIDPHAESDKHSDHPLSLDQDSKWNAFFKDNEILAEIDKDVKRTFPHLHFFNQISPTGQTIESPHYHILKRTLFIYAKLNPGIRYVQGMNELLGPIYYTFATDSDPAFKEHAEADAFFCFTNLMSEWRDNFCKTLDKSEIGVVANMKHLNMLLKEQDLEIWNDLEDKKMNPQFYTFRWITLLLSQEFELPDVLRLWDSLFADQNRFNFFYCFCCAMIICVRERILDGTFADNLKLLQSYPPIDFQVIFATALQVHEKAYTPPPPRKKTELPASSTYPSYTHTSKERGAEKEEEKKKEKSPVPPHPTPAPTTSSSSSFSIPSFFNRTSPAASHKDNNNTSKPQEKTNTSSILNSFGLGKFKM